MRYQQSRAMLPAMEHLLVRQRPGAVKPAACYMHVTASGRTTITGTAWHKVNAEVGEALRHIGCGELEGQCHRGTAFKPRFDVLSQAEFDKLVAQERKRLDSESRRAARKAAEDVACEVMSQATTTLGSTIVKDCTGAPETEQLALGVELAKEGK
jgi:hypothetical protein